MDNRINDTATPGCSHWAALPAGETQAALPSIQALSGVRNTDLYIQCLPNLAPASDVPLYLIPPSADYQAPELVIADQLRLLILSMKKQPSVEALMQLTGVSKSSACDALNAVYVSSENESEPESQETALSLFHSTEKKKEEHRIANLRQRYPRLNTEDNENYARRLLIRIPDAIAVSELSGLVLGEVQVLRHIIAKECNARAEELRLALPQEDNEKNIHYAFRLGMYGADVGAIAVASGAAPDIVHGIMEAIVAIKDGRAASIRQAVPQGSNESRREYADRLVLRGLDNATISAATGLLLRNRKQEKEPTLAVVSSSTSHVPDVVTTGPEWARYAMSTKG